jgi:hypothetical protein
MLSFTPTTYRTTTDLYTALTNNYIGEVEMRHTDIAAVVKWLFTGKKLKPWVMYYYGIPDLELQIYFGYRADTIATFNGTTTGRISSNTPAKSGNVNTPRAFKA